MDLFIIIGLVVIAALVLWRFVGGPGAGIGRWRGGGRRCRWKRDTRRHPDSARTRWICLECRREAYSSDGQPPKECRRSLAA